MRVKEYLEQLDSYIHSLRQELKWNKSGPAHKVRTKQLEVALAITPSRRQGLHASNT
jgi:hypothetical protein